MEIMQPAANVGLHKKEHEIYSDRLHQVVKSDAELKPQKISQHCEKCQQLNDRLVMTLPFQQKRQLRVQVEKRLKNIEELRVCCQKHSDIRTFNKATIVQVPKPPPCTSQLHLKRRQQQQQRREQDVQTVQTEIAQFETRKKRLPYGLASLSSGQPPSGDFPVGGISQGFEVPGSGAKLTLRSNSKRIQDIRQRLEEKAVAHEQEKRRDRFLLEQLKAHKAQEEAQREEQLVTRLTRQTQQEQRFATQLLQIHVQKDGIRENRLFREQQYQQRRERDFQEALEREAALAQQVKLDRAEEIRKELESCNRIAAERAQDRFKKHSQTCKDILEQVVDLATKVGEYRQHTGNLIPEKQMREWKELLFSGLPLYEPVKCQQPWFEFSAPLDPVELEKQEMLKNQDCEEYNNMVGEWAWPEEAGETKLPLTNSNILGHPVHRLRNIVHQPIMEPSPPSFPHFTIKACVLGNFCLGKTTCLAIMCTKAHGIYVLSADSLIKEALNAYHNGEEVTEQQGEKDSELLLTSSTSLKPDLDTQEESRDSNVRLSTRAMQGAAAEKVLREGNTIPNELLVDIMVEAIRQVPAQSGWILDGFPMDITEAYQLEKALGGFVDEGEGVVSSRTELAAEQTDNAAATTSHPTDQNLYMGQIPHRITASQDTWPKLEEWFGGRQTILIRVDADVDEEELHERVESVLQPVMMQTQEALTAPPDDDVVLDSGKAPDSPCSATPTPVDQAQGLTNEAHAESCISLDEEKAQSELPESLCSHWDTLCDSYVNNVKTTMHQLRSQQSVIQLYLFNMREEYKHYMGRPDLKQELVSHWQKDFNIIPDDIREDEDTKAELHLRLDDLREHLWDISDEHKEEDEKERAKLMGTGWLEEHTAVLVNHHSVLMQVELDHFQDTFRILKVYYLDTCTCMYREVLPELPSELDSIPLTDVEHQDESTEPAGRSVFHQMDDGEDKTKTKLHPDSQTENRVQAESVKLPHEKLISDYEEALTAIRNLVSAEAHQGETNEQERERTDNQEARDKIHKKYAAALDHEGNAAEARIALVKGHGLVMMQSLQSRAAQTLGSMEKWLEARYLAEMKSIDQLAQVVSHYIEAGAKLQYELVMEGTDFYLNGDCLMFASPAPPPRPPPLEKPTRSTLTVTQLESLHRQLCIVAPSGLMLSFHFFDFLMDIISMNMGRNTFPEPWINQNETQLLEIVSLLVDAYELIDWRQFLLSAALPWPFPSLSQLLVVLQRFKAADTGGTGYVNEDQYLQTELWFSNESVQPEDPSEPRPWDRLANLRKFFFQLFADRSFSPPRLDYVYMLQYFAADPDPRQGFIRALSVVLEQHIKHSSPGHLVESMASIEEASELSSSELDGDYEEEDTSWASSSSLGEEEVSIAALLAVTYHKVTQELVRVFRELGYKPGDCAPFSVLSQHPFIQDLMETSTQYQLVNIHGVLLANQDEIPEG